MDSWNDVSSILATWEDAQATTGIHLPLSQAGVADAPYSFEERLFDYTDVQLNRLKIRLPEAHDLALMKVVRFLSKDLDDIKAIHTNVGLRADILLERFKTEMGQVIGDPNRVRAHYLVMIETLFGLDEADKQELALRHG